MTAAPQQNQKRKEKIIVMKQSKQRSDEREVDWNVLDKSNIGKMELITSKKTWKVFRHESFEEDFQGPEFL